MYSFLQYLMESHPKTRAERRRESAKPSHDVRKKIEKIKKTMGSLSDEGQAKLKKVTDNFSKWPGDGAVKKLFKAKGPKDAAKPKIGDRKRAAATEENQDSED